MFQSPLTAEDEKLKPQFAALLLAEPSQAFLAAKKLFPNNCDTGKALYIATNWLYDDEVKAEQTRLIDENGLEAYLPGPTEMAAKLLAIFNDENELMKNRLAASKQYAEVMRFKLGGGAGDPLKDSDNDARQSEPLYKIVTE